MLASRIDVDTGGRISPALWPKAVIVVMGLLCAYEIVKRLVASRMESNRGLVDGLDRNPAQAAAAKEASGARAASQHYRMLASGIALIAAYVIAVPWTGFILTTTVFLILFPLVGGLPPPGLSVAIGRGRRAGAGGHLPAHRLHLAAAGRGAVPLRCRWR